MGSIHALRLGGRGLLAAALLTAGLVAGPAAGPASAEDYTASRSDGGYHARFCRTGSDGRYLQREQTLRVLAWRHDDPIAQFCLGGIYRTGKLDGNIDRRIDRVEAYVWYYLASVNQNIIGASPAAVQDFIALRKDSLTWRNRLYQGLILDERNEAFKRIAYILSSRGGPGFLRLGELYAGFEPLNIVETYDGGYRDVEPTTPPPARRYGIFPLPWVMSVEPEPVAPTTPYYGDGDIDSLRPHTGLPRSLTESLVYLHLAEEAGYPVASRMVERTKRAITEEALERDPRQGEIQANELVVIAQARAANWQPPFEVYPGGLSDPSLGATDLDDVLLRVELIDVKWFQTALKALGIYDGPIDNVVGIGTRKAYAAFQSGIFARETGKLTPPQKVLLIKTAALRDHRISQYVLGYMYHNCLGVEPNVFRAKHWFEKSAAQRYPYALYALSTYYKDGYGVEADLTKAEHYFNAAKQEGFGNYGYPHLNPVEPSCPYKG